MSLETEKSYPLGSESVQSVAYALAKYLDQEKNMITQTMRTSNGYMVQSKGDVNAEWTKYIGLDAALTIDLHDDGDLLKVTVGSGKWVEKAGMGILGAIIFQPLAWTASIGAARTAILYNDIFSFISRYLNAEPVQTDQPDATVRHEEAEIICPKCGAANAADHLFCSKCGAKLHEEPRHCTNCGAEVGPDDMFCPKCGTKLD